MMNDLTGDELETIDGGNLSCAEAWGLLVGFSLTVVMTGGAGIAAAGAVGAYMVYADC